MRDINAIGFSIKVEHIIGWCDDDDPEPYTEKTFFSKCLPKIFLESRGIALENIREGLTLEGNLPIATILKILPTKVLEKIAFVDGGYDSAEDDIDFFEPVLASMPFEELQKFYKERERLENTIDLISDDTEVQEPDGTGASLRIQAEQHATLVKVKVENSDLRGKLEEEKKSAAAITEEERRSRLELERMKECVICQDADKCVALFSCSHLALCGECQHVNECPICREKIEKREVVKVV